MPLDARDLCRFLDASPSPFHAVAEAARRLRAAGFAEEDPGAAPAPLEPGRTAFVAREGMLLAWRVGRRSPAEVGFRIVGAHTDSPGLRLKPLPDAGGEGWRQWAVEPYGGLVVATWLDRDLGLSGLVYVRGEEGPEPRLVRVDRPVARVPGIAIHLEPELNRKGVKLDFQRHLPPVVGLGEGPAFREWLAAEMGVEPEAILGWELGLHDTQPATVGGMDGEFVFSGRLDDLFSCAAAISALVEAEERDWTQVVALFDHEEVGSGTRRGADGPALRRLLERLVRDHPERAAGGLDRAAEHSFVASADMAHAVHPGWADRHEPGHKPAMNGGPVLKTHAGMRYGTDARGAAWFRLACAEAGVPCQDYAHHSERARGGTIGPISAADLGIAVADVGCAMLSMHSVREMCGARDPELYSRALRAALEV